MKYIYVAGPYTHPDPVVNTRNAILAGEELVKKGYVPFIPHLTLLWHMVIPHDLEYWYAYDLYWLGKCNALLRLPGKSKGADTEVKIAAGRGIPIYYSLDDL